eukprot:TRINITY_DN20005_c0_g1_i1.p1 TRINITY_DN20005_c0_g1~~TRINITY_DN20005_c0_g1_i1.p1  ORF type:complete len:198 (+),score=21.79 TRINITY_DN20005_c0_g1_i1:37-630(+)
MACHSSPHPMGMFWALDPDVAQAIVFAARSITTSSVCIAWRELLLEFRSSHVALAHELVGKWRDVGSEAAGGYFECWDNIFEFRADGSYSHWSSDSDIDYGSERYSRGRWRLRDHDHDRPGCGRVVALAGEGEQVINKKVAPLRFRTTRAVSKNGMDGHKRVEDADIGGIVIDKGFKLKFKTLFPPTSGSGGRCAVM